MTFTEWSIACFYSIGAISFLVGMVKLYQISKKMNN